MNFTTVTNTLGHSAEAILNEDVPQHRSQRDWESDHRPYYKYTAGGKENPQSVWLRRPGETWFYSGDRSYWEKLGGYDLSPLYEKEGEIGVDGLEAGDRVRRIQTRNAYGNNHELITEVGETGIITGFIPAKYGHEKPMIKVRWDKSGEVSSNLAEFLEKESKVKEAKYIAPRRYYGSVAELTHNVAKYIADSDRTGRHDHFGNLADLSFWKTHTVDEAVDILGGYIDSEKFCDDGKKRAFSYFNITKAKPEYEEVTVSCENLYNNFSQYHWFTPSSRPSRKVEQADVACIPGGVMLTVLKEV